MIFSEIKAILDFDQNYNLNILHGQFIDNIKKNLDIQNCNIKDSNIFLYNIKPKVNNNSFKDKNIIFDEKFTIFTSQTNYDLFIKDLDLLMQEFDNITDLNFENIKIDYTVIYKLPFDYSDLIYKFKEKILNNSFSNEYNHINDLSLNLLMKYNQYDYVLNICPINDEQIINSHYNIKEIFNGILVSTSYDINKYNKKDIYDIFKNSNKVIKKSIDIISEGSL